MPRLKKLLIQDFRNIALQEIDFSPNINCISGGNGEGKTNLLDAIWYLSMTKSCFSSSDTFNFRYGTDSFGLCGVYSMDNGTESRFSIQVRKGNDSPSEKTIRRDDEPYRRISGHIGILPVVMVSPSDSQMVSDASEGRRKFANSVLSQMSSEYLSDLQQYNRYLLQRNKLIKTGIVDDYLLDTLDEGLEKYGRSVFEAREAFTDDIQPLLKDYYESISGGREKIGIEYRSCFHKGNLRDTLRQNRDQDFTLRYTSAGVQRDDFIFTMNGHPIRYSGSQGQQKSFLVALKFAQYDFMCKFYGHPPILLLDDLFDKLDLSRVSNLLTMVSSNEFGQIFITDSVKTRIKSIVDRVTEDRMYYVTSEGTFMREHE